MRILKFFGDFKDMAVQQYVYDLLTFGRRHGKNQTKLKKNKNESLLLCAFDDRI